jgi:hypothetical protein
MGLWEAKYVAYLYPNLNSVGPNIEMSSLFDYVDGYIVKEFIDAENRMHPLCNITSLRKKSRINK